MRKQFLFILIEVIFTISACNSNTSTSQTESSDLSEAVSTEASTESEASQAESINESIEESVVESEPDESIIDTSSVYNWSQIKYKYQEYLPMQYYAYVDADEFYDIFLNNNIDKAMSDDNFDTDYDIKETIKKYIAIWRDELYFSVEILCEMLNEEDADEFRQIVTDWEVNMTRSLQFEMKILNNYGIFQGSIFYTWSGLNILDQYKNKTFDVKYLTLFLETSQPALPDNYQPIAYKFSYDEKQED
ncbi:MAG: hypothetical protein A2Y17_05795 [Clostridiales bacterium GWF2_38_85]|nr:MAG: hypothetical protein A2Y17_05795 [Clostridiales bacterium GWF2_38_85]HBL84005.1 hypothetical protein [Clostridiales bacterium]